MMRSGFKTSLVCLMTVWLVGQSQAQTQRGSMAARQSIVGSPHDLSAGGPGRIHAIEEEEVCIFCHAPHNTSGQQPLWNRHMPPTHYRIYESPTMDAPVDQPSGPSKMCLSCHDGSLAIGLLVSRPDEVVVMSQRTVSPGPGDLTQDLSDDHPIGFRYNRALASRDHQIRNPDLVSKELPLGKHGEMHCTTCHDPHNNHLGNFLRMPEVRSTICLSCHKMDGWHAGSHATSPAAIHGRAVDPRERLTFGTVVENGCANCHKIHSAANHEWLLRFRREDDNCLNCHNGSVARVNIASEMNKPSNHSDQFCSGRHSPNENFLTMRRHVVCTDCHNPHAAAPDFVSLTRATSPQTINNTMRYSSGVNIHGRAVEFARYDYEVCFKCHADGATRPRRLYVSRQVYQTNTRLEFQPSNPSFHPVAGPRNNPDVVSLRSPLRVGSVIKCTDCHNSDSSSGTGGEPTGPHGSIHVPLLRDNYSTSDFTTESAIAYALCYRCHERSSILGDEGFPLHSEHVVNSRASCAACHDSHGISRTQGNSRNHSNLINFDISVVRAASGGLGTRIEYEDLGPNRGSCTLTCHGVTHVRFEYGP